jgi:hypothetical protein
MDGTEIKLLLHISTQTVFAIHPGDTLTTHVAHVLPLGCGLGYQRCNGRIHQSTVPSMPAGIG